MPDRTIDIGYVHVGAHEWKNGAEQEWVCADNCPHPDHDEDHGACGDTSRDIEAPSHIGRHSAGGES